MMTLFISCTERLPVAPDFPSENLRESSLQKSYKPVTVLSQNIYVGADMDLLLEAQNPEDIPILAAQAFQTMLATNFPERAEALAKEVFETRPHLIGLQEVSTIRTQFPSDAIGGGIVPAEDVVWNYLEIYQQALRNYGLSYKVIGIIENIDVEVPMVSNTDPLEFTDIRLTDYDVVLARSDVFVKKVVAENYRANLEIPDLDIQLQRGFIKCNIQIDGCDYVFVNTHLESADNGGQPSVVQISQARELMSMLFPVKVPVIIAGDFNSEAESGSSYQIVTNDYRYIDVWKQNELFDNSLGYTFGHDADLRNSNQNFLQRIDFVFVRSGKPKHKKSTLKYVEASVLGDEIGDRTSSGLWPSDHGGVVATFQFDFSNKNKKGRNHTFLND